MKPLQKIFIVYEGIIKGFRNNYLYLPFTVSTVSPSNAIVDSKKQNEFEATEIKLQKLIDNFFRLFKWEEERLPIHSNLRGKFDFIIEPNADIVYAPAEEDFFQFFMPNSIAVPDRIYCEMAEIPSGYTVYANSNNLFDDLDFFPSTECSFEVYSESVAHLNAASNDSYYDGKVAKSNTSFDPDKYYSNSGYQFDFNLYSITDDPTFNGYTRVRVLPHPDLPLLSSGQKYVIRIDAKFDERDEGLLFSRPGRWMVSAGIYLSNVLAFSSIYELLVRAPKVPFFHLDSVFENAKDRTLLFLGCEFYEKIKFLTSDTLNSQHDRITIHFDTSADQFLTDLGYRGKSPTNRRIRQLHT